MISEESSGKFLKIDVEGDDQELWITLRLKLLKTLNTFLDTTLDHKTGQSIREEAKDFTSALLEHGKAKLGKASIDNEKTIAEIELLYLQKQRKIAETRKINAEAQAIEIENTLRSLKMSLIVTKALFIGRNGNEDIVFIKSVDSFLALLEHGEKKEQL